MKKNGKEKQPPQVNAQIVITLFDDGNFQCSGPFHDRIKFYGLLEMARDAVILHAGQKAQKREQAAAVKGSAPWWRKVFAPKLKLAAANDGSRAVAMGRDEAKEIVDALRGEAAVNRVEAAALREAGVELRKGEVGKVEGLSMQHPVPRG